MKRVLEKQRFKKPVKKIDSLPIIKLTLSSELSEDCLLDCGSSVNLLNKDMLNLLIKHKLVKKIGTNNLTCFSATNNEIEILGSCVIKIKIDRFAWNVKFLIAKELEWKILLGTPFIRESNMVLDLSKNICYFKFCKTVQIKLGSNVMCSTNNIPCVKDELNVGCEEARDFCAELVKKYPNVFTKKIGKALNFEYTIKVKNPEVVNLRPYPMSAYKQLKMNEILNDLLKQGIIRNSLSEYSSPSFLVKKGNSEDYRLVINYGKINSCIETVSYPLGELSDCYQYLHGASYFSVIDLSNSFHQITLSEESRKYTAFSAGNYQKYEYCRIPYGLNLGSALLSGYLSGIFQDCRFKFLIGFVDDAIIFSKTLEEHKEHLNIVLQRLSENNLTVNPSKIKLFHKEISFLGNIISKNEIKIDPERTKSLLQCKKPRTCKEVASFVGMVSYLSRYIPNYSLIAAPLNELRKKGIKFEWTQECETAFQKLKECVCNPPVLKIPCMDQSYHLFTDASELGCGSVLMQEDDDHQLKPVCYFSKKFSSAERCLSVYQKEALAVVYSFRKFHCYLEHNEFKLFTDNNALAWVLTHFRKLGKIGRWCEEILSLKFTVTHIKGKFNVLADFLSRNFESEDCNIKVEELREDEIQNSLSKTKIHSKKLRCTNSKLNCNSVTNVNMIQDFPMAFHKLSELQKSDEECQQIFDSIKQKTNKANFFIKNDVLMYKKSDKCKGKIYVPLNLIPILFQYYHCSIIFGGHPGLQRTCDKICEKFYRPNLAQLIKDKVNACDLCKLSKPFQRRYEGELISTYSTVPMEKLFIDTAGPLTRTTSGNQHILIVLDECTRFTFLIPIRNVTSRTIIDKLEKNIFSNFSTCQKIVSDNGSCFRSNEFKNFVFKNGIEHHRIVAYKPSGNKSERYLRNVKSQLRIYYHDAQNKWDTELHYLQAVLNTCRNESLGTSSHSLMFKHAANHALSNLWDLNQLVNENFTPEQVKTQMQNALTNIKKSIRHNRNRERYSDKKTKHPFVLGSRVFLEKHNLSKKGNKYQGKLDFRFSGPYEVLFFLNPVTVLIQNLQDRKDVRRANISQLKLG